MKKIVQICNKQFCTLDKFGRKYPPKAGQYYIPAVTTDSIVIKNNKEILLISRKNDPYKDCLAFPGGFIDYNENPIDGCLRELQEETGLIGKNPKLFDVRGDPQRDPRQHTVSVVYTVQVEGNQNPVANDDAKTVGFYKIEDVLSNNSYKMAFDHYEILKDFYEKEGKN